MALTFGVGGHLALTAASAAQPFGEAAPPFAPQSRRLQVAVDSRPAAVDAVRAAYATREGGADALRAQLTEDCVFNDPFARCVGADEVAGAFRLLASVCDGETLEADEQHFETGVVIHLQQRWTLLPSVLGGLSFSLPETLWLQFEDAEGAAGAGAGGSKLKAISDLWHNKRLVENLLVDAARRANGLLCWVPSLLGLGWSRLTSAGLQDLGNAGALTVPTTAEPKAEQRREAAAAAKPEAEAEAEATAGSAASPAPPPAAAGAHAAQTAGAAVALLRADAAALLAALDDDSESQ